MRWVLGVLLVLVLVPAWPGGMLGDSLASDNQRKACRPLEAGNARWITITLYKNVRFEGASCTFDGDIADLSAYSFAGVASSVRVQGGIWQLCDKPNYRGYCIELERSQTNFNLFGFNDRARSLRRIR